MDHGRNPHILLVALIVLFMIDPSVEIDYCCYVWSKMTWNDLARVFWMTLSDLITTLNATPTKSLEP